MLAGIFDGLVLKSLKKHNGYNSHKVQWDEDVVLTNVQILDAKKGYFKLAKDQIDVILQIEEHIIHLLHDEDTFVSSIVLNRKFGKVFKCISIVSSIDETIGRFCNLKLRLTRVKIAHDLTRLCWECVEITNSSECLIQVYSDDDVSSSDSEPVPDPSILYSIKADLMDRLTVKVDILKDRLIDIQGKLDKASKLKLSLELNDFDLNNYNSIEETIETL